MDINLPIMTHIYVVRIKRVNTIDADDAHVRHNPPNKGPKTVKEAKSLKIKINQFFFNLTFPIILQNL